MLFLNTPLAVVFTVVDFLNGVYDVHFGVVVVGLDVGFASGCCSFFLIDFYLTLSHDIFYLFRRSSRSVPWLL